MPEKKAARHSTAHSPPGTAWRIHSIAALYASWACSTSVGTVSSPPWGCGRLVGLGMAHRMAHCVPSARDIHRARDALPHALHTRSNTTKQAEESCDGASASSSNSAARLWSPHSSWPMSCAWRWGWRRRELCSMRSGASEMRRMHRINSHSTDSMRPRGGSAPRAARNASGSYPSVSHAFHSPTRLAQRVFRGSIDDVYDSSTTGGVSMWSGKRCSRSLFLMHSDCIIHVHSSMVIFGMERLCMLRSVNSNKQW